MSVWYRVLLWAIIAGGLVPAITYLAVYLSPRDRPQSVWTWLVVDASGWVIVLAGLFCLSGFLLVIGPTRALWVQIVRLAFGAALDGLLWIRLVHYLRARGRRTDGEG